MTVRIGLRLKELGERWAVDYNPGIWLGEGGLYDLPFRSRTHMASSGILITLVVQISFFQSGGEKWSLDNAEQSPQFIVAFELSPEGGFKITWPLESMSAAPYDTVLLVVEKTPRCWRETTRDKESESLLASRHLKINGRLQKPLRVTRVRDETTQVNSVEQFVVKLDQGRLRLSLSIPAGLSLDPQHRTATIKLYQINRDRTR